MILKLLDDATIRYLTADEQFIIRESYRIGDIIDVDVSVASQLLFDKEAEAYTGADPVSLPYHSATFNNPSYTTGGSSSLPPDAPGFLRNDGMGVIAWSDKVGEALTVAGLNTINNLSDEPVGLIEFFVNGVRVLSGISNAGVAVSVDPVALGYNIDNGDSVVAVY